MEYMHNLAEVLVLGEGQYSASLSYHDRNAMEHPLRNCVTLLF